MAADVFSVLLVACVRIMALTKQYRAREPSSLHCALRNSVVLAYLRCSKAVYIHGYLPVMHRETRNYTEFFLLHYLPQITLFH